ncbi:Hypothetical predicted protein [Octopus vulgaris]|uniref:Apple domain-containing protein n=1 Tax=Octopus vulgaris TaxID=6645 RepID=A0AA36BJ57_OCTVU|nr:Hypothetical predicted protein [Octopus vulgaris]
MSKYLLLYFLFPILLKIQEAGTAKCPVNVIYGAMLENAENIAEPEPKSYFFCMLACKENTSCYSANYNADTSACYVNHRNSWSANITLQSSNWIYTEIDRYKFDNQVRVLTDMNVNQCHVKFLFDLRMIEERSGISNDSMKRSVLFEAKQNTLADIRMQTLGSVEGSMACAIKCMEDLNCVGFRYHSFCEVALKY